ncbi:potassium channel family protein [Nanoarchaeota archaeon]
MNLRPSSILKKTVEFRKSIFRFNFSDFFDKVSFKKLFVIWIGVIFIFGIIFFAASYFLDQPITADEDSITDDTTGLYNSMYFSFTTAATVGYGDITPVGYAKVIAVIEAIIGLLIYGMVISKLVSVKQEKLLLEIHTMSQREQKTRLRSAFFLYRSDVNKFLDKVHNKSITAREVKSIWTIFANLEAALMDATRIIKKDPETFDGFDSELVVNTIELSLAKTDDFIKKLNRKKHNWKTRTAVDVIKSIITTSTELVGHYEKYPNLTANTDDIKELIKQIECTTESLEKKEIKA